VHARIRVYCDRFTAVSGRVAPGDVGCQPVHGRPPTAMLFMVSIPAYGCLFVAERCAYTGVPLDTQWPYHASLKRLTKPACDVVVKATIFFKGHWSLGRVCPSAMFLQRSASWELLCRRFYYGPDALPITKPIGQGKEPLHAISGRISISILV